MPNKLKKLSLVLRIMFWTLLILIPLIIFVIWFFPSLAVAKALLNYGYHPMAQELWQLGSLRFEQFSLKSKLIGFLGNFIQFLPLFLALLSLIKVYANYAQDKIFCLANAKLYNYLAGCFFIDGLLAKPLAQILMSYAFSLNTPRPMFGFGIGVINAESIFCGVIFLVVAKVMYLGWQMQQVQQVQELGD